MRRQLRVHLNNSTTNGYILKIFFSFSSDSIPRYVFRRILVQKPPNYRVSVKLCDLLLSDIFMISLVVVAVVQQLDLSGLIGKNGGILPTFPKVFGNF